MNVSPVPTDEEMAAIVAAFHAVRPAVVVVEAEAAHPPAWRFSGRWWTRPVPVRRVRPWS